MLMIQSGFVQSTMSHYKQILTVLNMEQQHGTRVSTLTNVALYILASPAQIFIILMVNPAGSNIQELQSVDETRDLGIAVNNQCKFYSNCKNTVFHANSVLHLLKRTIPSTFSYVFVKLYKTNARPVLDIRKCIV